MAVAVKGTDLRVQTLTQVVHILFFDTIHTSPKTHSGFSMSLACHVPFLFPPLRSLRGN